MNRNTVKCEHYCFSSLDAFVCDKCKKQTNNVKYIITSTGEMKWLCSECAEDRYKVSLSFPVASNMCMK